MQSTSITTNVYAFDFRSWQSVLYTTLCDKFCQRFAASQWGFFPGTLVSLTSNTDHHDINEILKVVNKT